jgi:integrase
MGSLTKDSRDRSKFWYACYRSGSKRIKKSTKTRDRKEAEKMLHALEHGEELAAQNSLTEDRLRELLNQTMQRINGKKAFDPTVTEWLNQWLQEQAPTVQPGTLYKYQHAVALFLEFLGPRATIRLELVTTQDILGFRDWLLKAGRAPSTVNLLKQIIALPFINAQNNRHITFNPAKLVKEIPDHDKPDKETFTAEQIQALLDAASVEWRGLTLAGYYTGARLTDLARLTWSNVDLSKGMITFIQKKTRKKVETPIHPELMDHLLTLSATDSGSTPVFPTLYDTPAGGQFGLSESFKTLMVKAGVAAGNGRVRNKGVGRSTSRLSYHALRHTFNSNLANLDVSQETRQKLTGHASADQNTHYTHHEAKTLRSAIDKIPRLQGKKNCSDNCDGT